MQYLGGKQKSGGAQIARLINSVASQRELRKFIEPFCGGLSVTSRVEMPQRIASDSCEALITLYRSMQVGWEPPEIVTRSQWDYYKAHQDPQDPMTAFVGFGCSRSGVWFSSYVEDYKYTKRRVPAATAARNSLYNKLRKCQDVKFLTLDYSRVPCGDIVYCDPPYKGTKGYGAVEPWDPERFWTWAREKSRTELVCVSEMVAPSDWVSILTFDLQHRIGTQTGKRRQEFLFVHESQKGLWNATA